MSNIVKIKHGTSPPTQDNLNDFELGYAENNKGLYTKDSTGNIVHLNNKTITAEETIDSSNIGDKELGYNTTDGKLYINNSGDVVPVSGTGGIIASETAPEDTSLLWIDISPVDGENSVNGIAKYYDPETDEWVPIASVWG